MLCFPGEEDRGRTNRQSLGTSCTEDEENLWAGEDPTERARALIKTGDQDSNHQQAVGFQGKIGNILQYSRLSIQYY